MKKLLALFVILSASSAMAQSLPSVKIKEIRAHLKTVNPDTTCMDEYLKRRSQLIGKLALSPVLIVGGTVASTYVGGVTATAITSAAGSDGWAQLGYAIGGAGLGLVAGAGVTIADTTSAALILNNSTTIVKALAEQYTNQEGEKSEELYRKYVKRAKSEISKEEFFNKLLAADANGSLCNGSMVKQPKIRLGSKLKYKVAKLKDVVREL